jgi:hypothetical protein
MRWMLDHGGDQVVAAPLEKDLPTPHQLAGQIIDVDPGHGSFVLNTEADVITLTADPADVAGMQVGQTLVVFNAQDEPARQAR